MMGDSARKIVEERLYQMNSDGWVVDQLANRSLDNSPFHPDDIQRNMETLLARILVVSLASLSDG